MSEYEIHDKDTNSNNNGSNHYNSGTTLKFRPRRPGHFIDQFIINVCEIIFNIHFSRVDCKFFNCKSSDLQLLSARKEGLEPPTAGFGDRYSTN